MHWVFLGFGLMMAVTIPYHLKQIEQGEHNHAQKPTVHAIGALLDLAEAAFFVWYALSLWP